MQPPSPLEGFVRALASCNHILEEMTTTARGIRVTPFAPALGAEVRGIDLARGLDDDAYREVRAAFLQYGVLFFKEQAEIPPAVQIAIGRMFGDLHMHPAAPQMPGFPELFVIH